MPGGLTKFQAKWLDKRDKNDDLISNWCLKGKTEFDAYCTVCKCYFSVSNSGISQILQHSDKQKHKSAANSLKGQKTLMGTVMNFGNASGSNLKPQKSLALQLTNEQLIVRAEALWVMKMCVSNFAFSSSQDIVALFQQMFEGHPVANNMKLSDRKVSYIISHGLGPFFQHETVKELKQSIEKGALYTLSFDETTTSQVKKQLDIFVRFWSSKSDCIVSAYLTSLFLGHATADILFNNIMNSLNENKLPLHKIIMIGMDGPNVNKAVMKKLNAELLKSNSSELLNIGTCCLHKVHNSFSKGLDSLPLDIDQFVNDLFGFFKCSPARRENLKDIQKFLDCEQKFLLRHVNSRWITLGPVVRRILAIYQSLEEYFLKFLPQQNNANVIQNSRFQRIVSNLKDPLTVAYLEFVSSIATVLEAFLTLFQMEGPLIHLMYNKTNELSRNIMLKFLKESCVGRLEGHKLLEIDIEKEENIRPLNDLDIGIGSRKALSKVKNANTKTARLAMRKSLINLYKSLKETLPVSNKILKNLEQLHPLMRSFTTDAAMQHLCVSLQTLELSEQVIDSTVAEWQTYRLDPDVDILCENFRKQDEDTEKIYFQPIDKFWSNVFKICDKFTGKPKYCNLSNVVKSCLSLAHGNADVERGFSVNNSFVSTDRSCLGEAAIVGLRSIKDAARRFGNILQIPITGKLLESVTSAHSAYAEEKRRENEEKQRKKKLKRMQEEELQEKHLAKKHKIENKEKLLEVDKNIQSLQEDLNAAQSMLKEGNERLHAAVKKKDYKEINIASTMIDAGTQKISVINEKLGKAHEARKKIPF